LVLFRNLTDEFINKYENSIQEGRNKYPLGRLITVGIYIKGKDYGICQQGNTGDSGKQGFVCSQHEKIF
jgi:hypothetical protein